jgi:riboflavin kinase/FMN adenylyltransferase
MAEPVQLAQEPVDESGLPSSVTATIVTVGTFDGVHRGHRDVLARLVDRGHATGLRSVLVTFDPHPLEVVNPARAPQLLTVREEKLELLAETGLDYVAILPFTRGLQTLEAEAFVDRVLRDRFRMHELLIGYDHGFGRGRSGDVSSLLRLGRERGFGVEVVPPVTEADKAISSSVIRKALVAGNLAEAAAALGRPYSISGRVEHGEKRGRLLGYPTLNLASPSPRKLLPLEGVYAVRAQTPAGTYGGMMNLGPRPTFGDERVSLEVHLFDAEVELYGAQVRLDMIERLRDTVRFSGVEALVEQLHRDADAARRALSEMVPAHEKMN